MVLCAVSYTNFLLHLLFLASFLQLSSGGANTVDFSCLFFSLNPSIPYSLLKSETKEVFACLSLRPWLVNLKKLNS